MLRPLPAAHAAAERPHAERPAPAALQGAVIPLAPARRADRDRAP
jgi:hypothetical protein